MSRSFEVPPFAVSYDLTAIGDRELTEADIVYSELHAGVLALGSIIAKRNGITEEEMLDHIIEFGKNAQRSLEDKKG